jgi:hypothetical protein
LGIATKEKNASVIEELVTRLFENDVGIKSNPIKEFGFIIWKLFTLFPSVVAQFLLV